MKRTMHLRLMLLLAAALATASCGQNEPVRIGFVGALTGRTSDVGEDARHGAMLAVEQRNLAGGIRGRTIELIAQDDGQNPQTATLAINALIDARVDAVIGPITSAMAATIVPIIDKAGLVTVSPTVTSTDFVGHDDYFIRVNRTTRDNARDYAQRLFQRGRKNVAVAYDERNRSFSASWLLEFRTALEALGGRTSAEVGFESQSSTAFSDIVRTMLASKPDGMLYIASAVDVGRLAQQAAKLAPSMPQSASEWAASEDLLELGGRAVNGLLIAQGHDREDSSERFRSFRDAFMARFAREPGYAAVNAHDAATVIFEAMARKDSSESLKAAILKYGPYAGLQQPIRFDRFGDTARNTYFTEVRDGRFVKLP